MQKEEAKTFVDPITLDVITVGVDEFINANIFTYYFKSPSDKTISKDDYGSLDLKRDKNCVKYNVDSLVNYLLTTGCFQEPTTKNQFTRDDIEEICSLLLRQNEKNTTRILVRNNPPPTLPELVPSQIASSISVDRLSPFRFEVGSKNQRENRIEKEVILLRGMYE